MLNHLAWGLSLFVLSAVPLTAQGWPGLSLPTKKALVAAGAVPYTGTSKMWVPPQKGEEALVLGSVVTIFSTVPADEFKKMTFTFDPLGGERSLHFTLPLEVRRELFSQGQLPRLPEFVREWGVDWASSANDWLKAVQQRRDFAGAYAFFAPQLYQDNTTLAKYEERSRHQGALGAFTIASSSDPRYSVSVRLDLVDATGADAPFALHSLSIEYSAAKASPALHSFQPNPENVRLNVEKRSALALSAILMGQNGELHESLNPAPWRTSPDADKKVLARDWGIHSREDLLEMLRTLDGGLHGKSYTELSAVLDAHPGVEPWRLSESLRMTPSRASRLLFVAATRQDLGPEGIRAWDAGRRVALARWGVAVDYLTEEEAWEVVLDTWNKLAGRYRSWNDYFYHYISGRAFWAGSFEDDLNKTNRALSEWAKLSWNNEGVWNRPWPGAENLATPDHNPWNYLYDPSREAHSLFDLMESASYSSDKPENEKQARARIEWATKRTPSYHLVTHELVELSLRFSKTDEALALAQEAAKVRPELARAWCDLGIASETATLTEQAESSFGRAIALDPNFYDALYGAARLRLYAGDWAGSLAWLERACMATPAPEIDKDGNFFYSLVYALNRVGRFSDALPTVEALLKAFPVPAVQFEAGVCYYSLGKSWWPQARLAFAEAIKGGRALPEFLRKWYDEK